MRSPPARRCKFGKFHAAPQRGIVLESYRSRRGKGMAGPIVLQALVAMGQTHEIRQAFYTSSDCSGSPTLPDDDFPTYNVTSDTGCWVLPEDSTLGAATLRGTFTLSCGGARNIMINSYIASRDCNGMVFSVPQAGENSSFLGCRNASEAQCSAYAHALTVGRASLPLTPSANTSGFMTPTPICRRNCTHSCPISSPPGC